MELKITKNYQKMVEAAALEIITQLTRKPTSNLMLPSGETAKGLYKILVSAYKKRKVSFAKASFFQLDDIIGSKKSESYSNYLRKRFIDHVNFKEDNLHLFNSLSNTQKKDCETYETTVRKKGIDLCVLGLGENGHIAFNEPGSKENSKTRIATLLKQTIKMKSTNKTIAKKVFTIGISTIMQSKKIIVIANGENKANAIEKAFSLKNFPKYPIAILNKHKNVTIITDKAGSMLYQNNKIFREYDIRGLVEDFSEDFAKRLGQTIIKTTNAKNIVVGKDGRASGNKLLQALIQGIKESGADVLSIGTTSTPVCYFVCKYYNSPGIMVTASHNPKEFNGFKIVKKDGLTIGMGTGLGKMRKAFEKGKFVKTKKRGKTKTVNYFNDYKKHILSFLKYIKNTKIVIDDGNSANGELLKKILQEQKVNIISVKRKKGDIGNPLIESNKKLKAVIKKQKADFGVAYDFDGDRVFFLDEKGKKINNEAIASIISKYLLEKNYYKGTILYDTRSDWIIKDTIRKYGGKAIMTRVGHSTIKALMKKEKALYCGEISGHNYYKDNFYADSALITTIHILSIFSKENKKFSKLVGDYQKNILSGEINFKVKDREAKLNEIKKKIKGGKRNTLDGIRIDYDNWWFNIRPSKSEPFLRLAMGAKTKKLFEQKKKMLTKIISS